MTVLGQSPMTNAGASPYTSMVEESVHPGMALIHDESEC